MKKINLKKMQNGGFTIIETLVAITILMISIAGPLTIAQKGLTASIYARDQITASYLSQELMEKIKNDKRSIWSTIVSDCSGSSVELVRFTRSCSVTVRSSDEITVTVTVNWSNGTVNNSVALVNEMFNIQL
ncbi:MAG: prepilin-type N-terminal cleavage/methylation domain-containing protein [Patescibacteria group bacterium]